MTELHDITNTAELLAEKLWHLSTHSVPTGKFTGRGQQYFRTANKKDFQRIIEEHLNGE